MSKSTIVKKYAFFIIIILSLKSAARRWQRGAGGGREEEDGHRWAPALGHRRSEGGGRALARAEEVGAGVEEDSGGAGVEEMAA